MFFRIFFEETIFYKIEFLDDDFMFGNIYMI